MTKPAQQPADYRKAMAEIMERCSVEDDESYDADDLLCAHCGRSITVIEGCDWERGDWCHLCWQTFGEKARIDLLRMTRAFEKLAHWSVQWPSNERVVQRIWDESASAGEEG